MLMVDVLVCLLVLVQSEEQLRHLNLFQSSPLLLCFKGSLFGSGWICKIGSGLASNNLHCFVTWSLCVLLKGLHIHDSLKFKIIQGALNITGRSQFHVTGLMLWQSGWNNDLNQSQPDKAGFSLCLRLVMLRTWVEKWWSSQIIITYLHSLKILHPITSNHGTTITIWLILDFMFVNFKICIDANNAVYWC